MWMPYNCIKTILLLRKCTDIINGAISLLGNLRNSHFVLKFFWVNGLLYFLNLCLENLTILFRTSYTLLHITATVLRTILVVGIFTEYHPHSINVNQNVFLFYCLCYLYAYLWIWSDTASTVYIKFSIRTGYKTQITHSCMRYVLRRTGKTDFVLARKLFHIDELHSVLTSNLSIRHYIKIFILIYARERRTGSIARKVTATADSNNAYIKSTFHNIAGSLKIQIMQLYCLAGSKMHLIYTILANRFCHISHLFLSKTACWQTKAKHTKLYIITFLGIASKTARNAFILITFQLTSIILGSCFLKSL